MIIFVSYASDMNKERVLCTIRIDSNGSIIMKPDFNKTPYLIYTFGNSRGKNTSVCRDEFLSYLLEYFIIYWKETYEYVLEHISSKISADNLIRELRLHKELYMRHSEYIKNLVGNVFKMVFKI